MNNSSCKSPVLDYYKCKFSPLLNIQNKFYQGKDDCANFDTLNKKFLESSLITNKVGQLENNSESTQNYQNNTKFENEEQTNQGKMEFNFNKNYHIMNINFNINNINNMNIPNAQIPPQKMSLYSKYNQKEKGLNQKQRGEWTYPKIQKVLPKRNVSPQIYSSIITNRIQDEYKQNKNQNQYSYHIPFVSGNIVHDGSNLVCNNLEQDEIDSSSGILNYLTGKRKCVLKNKIIISSDSKKPGKLRGRKKKTKMCKNKIIPKKTKLKKYYKTQKDQKAQKKMPSEDSLIINTTKITQKLLDNQVKENNLNDQERFKIKSAFNVNNYEGAKSLFEEGKKIRRFRKSNFNNVLIKFNECRDSKKAFQCKLIFKINRPSPAF
jgi:hypothetical protein